MKLTDTVKLVTRNLKRRKGRTILTAIGVTIGTAAIVAMLSLTIGLKENVVKSVSKLGSFNEIEIYPGYYGDNPRNVPQLNHTAIDRIKLLPGVSAVMPRLRFGGQPELQFGRKAGYVEVMGVDPQEGPAFGYQMTEGKYLTGRNQAVITENVPDNLSDKKKSSRRNSGPETQGPVVSTAASAKLTKLFKPKLLNKNVTLEIKKVTDDGQQEKKQFNITVVGVKTAGSFFYRGGTVYVPMDIVKEMNRWIGGPNSRVKRSGDEVYDSLVVKVPDKDKVEEVVNQIRMMGFMAMSPATQLQEVNKVFLVVQIVLGGIGAVSLLVATIGIINTMVMSILERTREIGIMKVLGATIPNVRNMFIIEAGAIGFIGGIVGLLISFAIAGIINIIFKLLAAQEPGWDAMDRIAVIPWWLTLAALAFASIVGILAGIYPALRAARLSPLNAIRQE